VDDARTIQVYSSNDNVARRMHSYVGKRVQVRGKPFAAQTAHHHAPVVMDIAEIN
jgi:hypothetical protein